MAFAGKGWFLFIKETFRPIKIWCKTYRQLHSDPIESRQSVAWDVTVVKTFAASYCHQTAFTTGAAAECATTKNFEQIQQMSISYHFIHLVLKTKRPMKQEDLLILEHITYDDNLEMKEKHPLLIQWIYPWHSRGLDNLPSIEPSAPNDDIWYNSNISISNKKS